MQISNRPTQPMKQYFDSRRSNRSGRFFFIFTKIQTVLKPPFYPLLCQCLMKIILVINPVCTCVRTSAEDDDFQTLSKAGGVMCAPNDFI